MKKIKFFIRLLIGRYSPNDYIVIGRILSTKKCMFKNFYQKKFNTIGNIFNLEILNFSTIGKNLVLGHPFGITVNPKTTIGDNCVLFKNSTIGSVRSGKRAGVPVIGDNCVVGVGAFVCGGIHIGNDVLICANAFVDFDVPDHSIVLGNPGIIHHKNNATRDYMGLIGD